jgi:hypothetical protein
MTRHVDQAPELSSGVTSLPAQPALGHRATGQRKQKMLLSPHRGARRGATKMQESVPRLYLLNERNPLQET